MSKRVVGAAAAVAAVFVLLLPAGATAAPERTAVVGIEADPLCLNVLLTACGTFVSNQVAAPVLAGAFRVRPDFTFEPMLVERVDVQAQPFALTYHIRPDAVWSDGTPVSADDFLFTLETILDPANGTRRDGYERVTGAVKLDAKTVTVQFSAPNPDWRRLFQYVLPRHVLAGHDFDQVWRDEIADPVTHLPIASGAFLATRWARGDSITLARNARWWGRPQFLDTIELEIVPFGSTQFDRIRNGTLDLIFPQPQFGVAELRSVPGVVVESGPGNTMEHLDFNVQSATMPLLRERWFRQAVAHALDRAAIATASHTPIADSHPALHNLTFSTTEPAYEPVFASYAGSSAAVADLMLAHGCALGADGIWACGGVRASLTVATTLGNATRQLVLELMVVQARAAGIELVPRYVLGGVLFGTMLPARDYQAIMFAWVRGAGLPSIRDLYSCAGQNNFMGYCSPAVDALAAAVQVEVDPLERARLVNDANRILAEDVPSLPLFMRMALLVRRDVLRGPELNPGGFGTWNTEAWRFGDDLVPPTTTAAASPGANANGWNDGPVTVTLAATDDDSGVHDVHYALSGAQTGGAVVAGSGAEVTVSAEGVTTLEYYATDWAGNGEAAKTLTIRIDRTAPVLSCAADPSTLRPPTRKLVPVQTSVDVSDGLSGPDGFRLLSVAGGDAADAADVVGFDLGSADTFGSLRAELDRGQPRRYELVYEGADRAGNTASCTVAVTVIRGR